MLKNNKHLHLTESLKCNDIEKFCLEMVDELLNFNFLA